MKTISARERARRKAQSQRGKGRKGAVTGHRQTKLRRKVRASFPTR
jgi:hypothetical protein